MICQVWAVRRASPAGQALIQVEHRGADHLDWIALQIWNLLTARHQRPVHTGAGRLGTDLVVWTLG